MSKWICVKNLKKEPYRKTANISCAEHCPMDILLEELSGMGDINTLVVGVGECAYYSKKIPFAERCKNWAYELANEEIIFGDVNGICKALERLSDSPYMTVCIFTCIPCLMNLQFDEIKQKFPNVIFLSAPDYKGISPCDILDELYVSLFGKFKAGEKEEISIWSWNEECSVQESREKLLAKNHIVNNYHYVRLFDCLMKKFPITVIDNSRFQSADFYRTYASELHIEQADIYNLEELNEQVLSVRKPFTVKGSFACDFAAYLHMLGAEVKYVVVNIYAYSEHAYKILHELPADVLVCFDWSAQLDEAETLILDFSACQKALSERQGFERLLFMMHRAEELCR
ncbi:MAG: hypothetical protein KH354_00545 [Clostridiales bacterium]|nr:hypothetical protein [Clostridiales bacterium]